MPSYFVDLRDRVSALEINQRRTKPTDQSTTPAVLTPEGPASQELGFFWLVEERDGLYALSAPPDDDDFDASAVTPASAIVFGVPSTLGEMLWPMCTVCSSGANMQKIIRARLFLHNQGPSQTVTFNFTGMHNGSASGSTTHIGMSIGPLGSRVPIDLDTGSGSDSFTLVGAGNRAKGVIAATFTLAGGAFTEIVLFVTGVFYDGSAASLYATRTFNFEVALIDGTAVLFDLEGAARAYVEAINA